MNTQVKLTKKERRDIKRQTKEAQRAHQAHAEKTKKYITRSIIKIGRAHV